MKKWACLALIILCTIFLYACSCEHSWTNATCTTPVTCSKCGETAGESLGHFYQSISCTEPKICSVCRTVVEAATEHSWLAATCDAPKTCSVCGATEGAANGHSWIAATRTEPKTCSACKKTEGGVRSVLTAEEIYHQCSPAVFYIEVYNAQGKMKGSGSGFFIDNKGTAVTNFHVIDGCASARITVSDTQKKYDVLGVYNYSIDEDWAVIKVDGTGFQYLEIGEGETVIGGATVYAIGSPLGLQNTISQGLISNPTRQENGMNYIQTTAAISSGSSGGALIDELGGVIGITSASYVDGQNLNLAVPMSCVNTETNVSLKKLTTIEKSVSIEDPIQYLKDFLVRNGVADALTGGTETFVTYSLEMKDSNGVAYSLLYALNSGWMYISKDYSTQFNDISTNLYFSGAGTNEFAAKAVFNFYDNYDKHKICGAFVYRECVTNIESIEFLDWFGDSSLSQQAGEAIFYGNILDLINMADYIFDYYDLPITMADFGFVY